MADAILALQITTGMTPASGVIQTGYAPAPGDVNNDGRIGIAEVIYILQIAMGVR